MLTRKIMNAAFSIFSVASIIFMTLMLLYLLIPIFWQGMSAVVFRATCEHRRNQLELFGHGDRAAMDAEMAELWNKRRSYLAPLFAWRDTVTADATLKRRFGRDLNEVVTGFHKLFGPFPGEAEPALPRDMYGESRWDRALLVWNDIAFRMEWLPADPSNAASELVQRHTSRAVTYAGTPLEGFFKSMTEEKLTELMNPRMTLYWRFWTEDSRDSHFFGGIGAEVLGTIFLTLGAMFIAVPMGVVAAIYLAEYAHDGWAVGTLRTCIGALAGVPSIVFGLFGLAFFLNTLPEWIPFFSAKKNLVAGSMTLALLILPTIIRAAEEAVRSVPQTFKEAAMGLGASRWRSIVTVILPAAMPGILTGIVISMGRAAGETAPIMFTAAISMGMGFISPGDIFSSATQALPWNIYNLCSEHEAVEEVRHVQFGMVLTLVGIVLLLNLTAIWLRARIARKMRG